MIFSIALILFDQLSKYLVRSRGGFYICNANIAFGIKINTIVFYVLWILIISGIFILTNSKIQNKYNAHTQKSDILNSKRFWNFKFGISLIISGAVSNIIDRLYFGCVIDFIKLPYWPFFNLADTFIVIGVILSVYTISKNKN